jgi:hypothetical protein
MSDTSLDCAGDGAASPESHNVGAASAGLALAAAPTFLAMAALTAGLGDGRTAMLCAPAMDASPLTGMIPMYLLMGAFHAGPWLRLIANRRTRARRT